MEIFKIVAICLCTVVLISIIKNYRPEFALYLSTAASVLILVFLIDSIKSLITYFSDIYSNLNGSTSYFPILIKSIIIAYITDFTSEIAKEQGANQLASKVELAGKLVIFVLAIPIFSQVFMIINNLL